MTKKKGPTMGRVWVDFSVATTTCECGEVVQNRHMAVHDRTCDARMRTRARAEQIEKEEAEAERRGEAW